MRIQLIIILCLVSSFHLLAQEYYSGCLINDSAYNAIPRKVTYLTRDYTIMPTSYSLKPYCPIPRNQNPYGTCTAWATAYAARTIAEAVANDWQNKEKITQEAFSPLYIYSKVKRQDDENCRYGVFIEDALKTMATDGVVKFKSYNVNCSPVPESLMQEAQQYKIEGYFTLFNSTNSSSSKIEETKKAISQNKAVIIAMRCYDSFYHVTDVWNGTADKDRGYHAMCVIGYDDNKNGGSFQLMNSWGTNWGNGGFSWVSYDDYCKNVNYSYVMDVRKKVMPTSTNPGLTQSNTERFSEPTQSINLEGKLNFKLSTKDEMHPKFYSNNAIPCYRMTGSYISGTRYRIYVSNNEPAYIYIIGSDLTKSVSLVFPPTMQISPALIYQSNNIAVPNEEWYIEMDNTAGTDYVCVLYSATDLPIYDLVEKIKNAPGSFYDKIKMTLSSDIVPMQEINYDQDTIHFSVKGAKKTIVPIIVEITHK